MQKLSQNQSVEQQFYIKSRLIHNLQNYLVSNEKKKECLIKGNPLNPNLFLNEQYKLKIHGLQNKPLHSLAVLYKSQVKN
ncbi:unnamed protein product [Paramecium octaurelia]|uniref:Uncharacterized protein n=1 Tax=Paramecium octaurelia TaxID=43137 RepID=A0A8S1YP20_PAROT|nr:unnamed protein product [Paramecium octaurelia]